MRPNQPKTFYGYKIDDSNPFELQIKMSLDYDVKQGEVIRVGENGVAIAVADTPAEKRGSFIISGVFFVILKSHDVKVNVGDFLGCDLSNADAVGRDAPNSLPLYQVTDISYPKDGSYPVLFLAFTQPVHP